MAIKVIQLMAKSGLIIALSTLSMCARFEKPVPARGFVFRGEQPYPGFGAYGYLVLGNAYSKGDSARSLDICKAFLTSFPMVDDYAARNPAELMVTFWLLEKEPSDPENLEDCDWLVANYDFARGMEIISAVDKLQVAGPLLVAWQRPYGDIQAASDCMVFDLSDFEAEDFERALGIWRSRICRDPATWQGGFDIIKIREAFRSFIQKYGEHIFSLLDK